ncbi:MAG: hypothetical protein PHN35_04315 [Clostridia bacterium]|nr:hypothetical protein [Clostridia bacterium]MDD4798676.1 hypothetical protein [Clostridia bacterium]
MLQKAKESEQELELPDDACLGDILTLLEIPEYLIALITVDKLPSEKTAALYDGAYVEFFPMFAGG